MPDRLFGDAGNLAVVCAERPDKQRGPLAKPSDPNYTAGMYVGSDSPSDTSKSHVVAAQLVAHNRNFAFNRQVASLCTPDGLAVSAT
jgi:hypothetical protein